MSDLFFRNPRLLALTLCLILAAGASAYIVMPRLEDPELTQRAASIRVLFPGASPDRVETLIMKPLEDELREIEEIKEFRSVSRTGHAVVQIELRDDVLDSAPIWSRVRDKMDDAAKEFPPGTLEPEFELLKLRAFALVVGVAWADDDEPNIALLHRYSEEIEDRLISLPGTEEVELYGEPEEEILVEIRNSDLAAIGLTADEVAARIQASDAKVAAGQFRSEGESLLFEVAGELDSIQRVGNTPIHFGDGEQFVLLSDLADVRKGARQPPAAVSIIDGQRAVSLGVLARNNQRLDYWRGDVQIELDQFEKELPPSVRLVTVFDQIDYVNSRLHTLMFNLALGAIAVVAVIFFLMGWRSALIIGAALPLAALMVLAGLQFLGIPLHQMSITGLIIALGLLIDNAIVIVDETKNKLHEGVPPGEAVSSSVKHLAIPLLGSTLTTALAFAPLALMAGPAGEFVGSIAVSVILAISSSFILAMTIIPTLTALGSRLHESSTRAAWWRSGFSHPRLTAFHRSVLLWIFRRPLAGIGFSMLLPVLGFVAFSQLSEQFFPPADRDQLQIELDLPPHASLAATLETTEKMRLALLEHPEVEGVDWFVGRHGPPYYYNILAKRENDQRFAHAMVRLKSHVGAQDLIHELQTEFDSTLPHARTLVLQLEQGPPFESPISVRLYGPDTKRLRELGGEIRVIMSDTTGVIHARSDLNESIPKIAVDVDEEQARLAGVDHRAIARQLDASLEGVLAGSVLEETEELPVRVRVSQQDRGELARIASLDIVGGDIPGQRHSAPLSALATLDLIPEQASIPHFNGRRTNEIQGFLVAGDLPADALAGFQSRLAASDFQLPAGYSMEYGGEAAKRDDAVSNLVAKAPVLAVLMLAVLVLSFQSFRLACLIGGVAFLSIGLGTGALWVFGYPFGFMAIIGTMGLVGVAINDSIVVLAALREDPLAKQGDAEAVRDVVTRASRHVIATTFTTAAGFIPLIVAGGGFWPPLAVAIAGGVGGATLLALYFTPCVYILIMCPRCPIGLIDRSEAPVPTDASEIVATPR